MTALIILGVLAGLGIAGLTVACINQSRVIHKMGNQLISNSDYQIKRIESENGLAASLDYGRRITNHLNGHVPMEPGAMDIPER
jgi:hypothetical protein